MTSERLSKGSKIISFFQKKKKNNTFNQQGHIQIEKWQ